MPRFDPPYVAVIFTSLRTTDAEGYAETDAHMEELASQQPGYLGIDSAYEPGQRFGITVSYWRSEADAAAWKRVADHVRAQKEGRARWYDHYDIHVANVSRSYGFRRA